MFLLLPVVSTHELQASYALLPFIIRLSSNIFERSLLFRLVSAIFLTFQAFSQLAGSLVERVGVLIFDDTAFDMGYRAALFL